MSHPGPDVARRDHTTAYPSLNDQLIAALSTVTSPQSAQDFVHHGAELVRKEARQTPEFYAAEFISISKDSTVAHVGAEGEAAQQATRDAQVEARVASVELNAR